MVLMLVDIDSVEKIGIPSLMTSSSSTEYGSFSSSMASTVLENSCTAVVGSAESESRKVVAGGFCILEGLTCFSAIQGINNSTTPATTISTKTMTNDRHHTTVHVLTVPVSFVKKTASAAVVVFFVDLVGDWFLRLLLLW